MAAGLKEEEEAAAAAAAAAARRVYAALQGTSCPLVEGLYLKEADSMLQLLCVPSQHRTDILAWICSSINPNFGSTKGKSMRPKDSDTLTRDMAVFGQEMMLCKADDLDLIRGEASPHRQLQFLEQLLNLVPSCTIYAGQRTDAEMLLNELFSAENLPLLTQLLEPSLNPWPSHIKTLRKGTKISSKSSKEEAANAAALLQQTKTALEQLQSECEFLSTDPQTPFLFSPSSLRVAAFDLQQLMTTFRHVYESDLRSYCSREPPSFSTETNVFQRVHQLLLTFITEVDVLQEVSEASVSVTEEVNQLQTQPRYWSLGEKRTLEHQLEELTRRVKDFSILLQS